jgi:hypothetical protein
MKSLSVREARLSLPFCDAEITQERTVSDGRGLVSGKKRDRSITNGRSTVMINDTLQLESLTDRPVETKYGVDRDESSLPASPSILHCHLRGASIQQNLDSDVDEAPRIFETAGGDQ